MRVPAFLALLLVAPAAFAPPAAAQPATARPVPDPASVARPPREATAPDHGGPVRALALSADGGALASGGFDERLLARPLPDGPPRGLRAHGGGVSALAALPGGGWASGGEDGRLALWADLSDADAPRALTEDGAPVTALAARGEGLLATARDGSVRWWDLRAAAPRPLGRDGAVGARGGQDPSASSGRHDGFRVLGQHDGPATAATFRADGAPVTAGADGTVRAWRNNGASAVLLSAGAPVTALLGLPDGTLAAAVADGRLLLLGPDGATRPITAGARPMPALAASADGRLLLAASLGGAAALWSLPDGRLRAALENDGAPVWSVALSADGAVAWTGGADGRVLRWSTLTGRALDDAGGARPVAQAARPADARGARVFRACAACHALRPDDPPRAGPHLAGLFGRRMGELDGYAYSARLARGDILWTPGSVADLFTRGPASVLPGTRMPDQRVSDPEDLSALLRFLAEAAP